MDPDVRTKLEESLCSNTKLTSMVRRGIGLIKDDIMAKIASNPEAALITGKIMELISGHGDKDVIKMLVVKKLLEHVTKIDLNR